MPIVSGTSGWRPYYQGMTGPLTIILAALLLTAGSTGWAIAAPGPPTPPGQAATPTPPPAAKPGKPADTAKEDKPAPPGKPTDDKPTPPGKAKETGEPAGPGKAKPPPPGQTSTTGKGKPKPDQDAAQDAVQADQALPLVEIVKIAKSLKEGRVVNARLLRVNGVLLYQLTMLDESGHSWRDYYLARSGNPVNVH